MVIPRSGSKDLTPLLSPRSIAVIGASNDVGTIRGKITSTIISSGFPGPIYPVTRSHREIDGHQCFATLEDLPGIPDLAVIAAPAAAVPEILEHCGALKVPSALVISSGFSDQSDDEGAARQAALLDVLGKYEILLNGPNSEGFLNTNLPLAATFSPAIGSDLDKPILASSCGDNVGIVSQSGGMGFSIYDLGKATGLSISHVIATGNGTSLDFLDYATFLVEQTDPRVLVLYLESTPSPEKLETLLRAARRNNKPIIAAKMGKSDAGATAAVSHTGNLIGGGSDKTMRSVLAFHGVTLVEDMREIVAVSEVFSRYCNMPPLGKRVGILSPSGGAGIWMTDTCSDAGLSIPALDEETRSDLQELLPTYGIIGNPVDITAQGAYQLQYAAPLAVLAKSPAFDSIVCMTSTLNPHLLQADRDSLVELREKCPKPIVFCSYTRVHPDARAILGEAGFPCIEGMRDAASALVALAEYGEYLRRSDARESEEPSIGAIDQLADYPGVVPEYAAKKILGDWGIPFPPNRLVNSPDQAEQAFSEFAMPVAMKVQSPDVPHKHKVGGVVLNVQSGAKAAENYSGILKSVSGNTGIADVELSILIEPMVKPGAEFIVGTTTDPAFGPMIVLGLGGVDVEVIGNAIAAPLPINRDDACWMIMRLQSKCSSVKSHSWNGELDLDALADTLCQVSRFAYAHRESVREIDLNPVLVHDCGVSIVDALIVKHENQGGVGRR